MIEVKQHEHIGVLQMAHGKANALDVEFCEAMTAELKESESAPVQALVLVGRGQIFSAGVDLLRILDGGSEYVRAFLPAMRRMFETLFCFPKPVVAAVNGHAIAGGCVLASAADYRVMADQTGRIGVPELLVGVPFPTIALEIMRGVGLPHQFPDLLYGGATFEPARAQQRGLVDELSKEEELLEQAIAKAKELAALPPRAFQATKQQIRGPALKRVREEGPEFDKEAQQQWESPETLEAIKSYVERTFKRPKV